MKTTVKKQWSPGIWVMECPSCENILASASEKQYLPEWTECDCTTSKTQKL